MSGSLGSLNPLSYMGVGSRNPPNVFIKTRNPDPTDIDNFVIGAIWINKDTENVYSLTNKEQSIATWTLLGGTSAAEVATITTDDGAPPVTPDSNGNINLLGGVSVQVTGNGPADTATVDLREDIVVDKITIHDTPVDPTDGTNKAYVDLVAAGFNFKNTTEVSTTANLTATYDNGTAGVGATLTNSGTLAAFSSDGITPGAGQRVLVQFQTDKTENGIYTVTTEGDGATPWVLTRATDFDEPAEIQQGDLVPVAEGTLYGDTFWIQTDEVITIGTDPINFNRFSTVAFVTTQYASLVGGPNNTIVSVSPSTAGVPLVSTGASSNPSFTTATVPGGGSGKTSFTAYTPVCGGTTTTGALQSVASIGTAGQVLTSNGAGQLPTFQTNSSGALTVEIRRFTSSGTYTPTSGMAHCIIEMVGGGGGGAGAPATNSNQVSVGTAGGGGEYARGVFTAAEIGASKPVTIGAGGSTGTGADGSDGGTTSVGTLMTALGGKKGITGGPTTTSTGVEGSLGGNGGTGGDFRIPGDAGAPALAEHYPSIGQAFSRGNGGSSFFGAGGRFGGSLGAGNGLGYGAGGSGTDSVPSQASKTGGTGSAGVVIITEYILG